MADWRFSNGDVGPKGETPPGEGEEDHFNDENDVKKDEKGMTNGWPKDDRCEEPAGGGIGNLRHENINLERSASGGACE